jgi:hypothetical protein
VGYDTAVRILYPHYYGNGIADLENALHEIQKRGCNFLVAGRAREDGRFYQVGDLAIPQQYQELFQRIPGELFRKDISSTELRRTGKKGSR